MLHQRSAASSSVERCTKVDGFLLYHVSDIMILGVDVSGLTLNLRSMGKFDGRHVVLVDDSRFRLWPA